MDATPAILSSVLVHTYVSRRVISCLKNNNNKIEKKIIYYEYDYLLMFHGDQRHISIILYE